jgi:sigma-B regulation protein RsbU (phosphoserine phosphatase)
MNTSQTPDLRTDIAALAAMRAPVIRLLRNMRREALAIQERQSLTEFPHVGNIECYGKSQRAGRAGGDFFDVAAPVADELNIGLGSLSTKGIAGPILLSGLQATLHSLGGRGTDLPGIFFELNRIMWNIAPERTFASLFSARVVPLSGRIHYVNAGHEAALLVRAGGRVERLEPDAPVLGLSRLSKYHRRTVRFDPGDTLIALSEGTEAGARKVLAGGATVRFRDLPARIIEAAESLPGTESCDRTALVIHYHRTDFANVPSYWTAPRKPLAAAA